MSLYKRKKGVNLSTNVLRFLFYIKKKHKIANILFILVRIYNNRLNGTGLSIGIALKATKQKENKMQNGC